ncbi:hypothetical protein [Chryseobacterium defluvii]|uniref:LysM domain-containing protein n=1 Tax=Chryseobacterium defluvii TaxID=160396 RepID=A0A495SBM2_9FLAO|nr:hypothetical protein [Chryseobacterium defluvii]RKS97395.1 hypothetical protein BCF58_1517 [Chryseobacterium defluvii]
MIIHFILPGETLQSISDEIQLENAEYLKEYHNERCGREERIDNELLPGKKLLIPDIVKIKEYNSRNDAPFKRKELNPELKFNPENLHQKYQVSITEGNETNGIVKNNETSFDVTVQWMRREDEQHVFHLSKNNFRSENGGKMGDLATECIQSLNPIEVITNSRGKVLKIALTKEVEDNFKHIKERLTDLFSDQYAALYIEEFEYAILNKTLFNERMKEDTFIRMYFSPLRNTFKNGKTSYEHFITHENIPVTVNQKVEDINYSEEITLLQNLKSEEPQNIINYIGTYTLYTHTGIVKKADINYNISQYGVKYLTAVSIASIT